MSRYLVILGLIFGAYFLGSRNEKNEKPNRKSNVGEEKMIKLKSVDNLSVVSLYFPTDNGKWVDRVVSSFTAALKKTGMSIGFSTVGCSFLDDDFEDVLKKTKALRPNVIFLPDDLIYAKYAVRLHEELPKSKIIFSSFYTLIEDTKHLPEKVQTGVVATAPIESLLKIASVLGVEKIGSIGVVGGPLAAPISSHIEKRAKALGIQVSIRLCDTWGEYLREFKEFEASQDAVWPLAPFGVVYEDGRQIDFDQFRELLKETNTITLGYGATSTNPTISMQISPEKLGENAAEAFWRDLNGGSVGPQVFKTYTVRISHSSLKRLNLRVPDELVGFLVE